MALPPPSGHDLSDTVDGSSEEDSGSEESGEEERGSDEDSALRNEDEDDEESWLGTLRRREEQERNKGLMGEEGEQDQRWGPLVEDVGNDSGPDTGPNEELSALERIFVYSKSDFKEHR